MDSDEQLICNYLNSWPGEFISTREISRRASGKSRFRDKGDWAAPVLARMTESGILECDGSGHYRLCEDGHESKCGWIAPHLRKLLQRNGKDISRVLELEAAATDKGAAS